MSLSSDNTVMTMPVAPAYGGGYGSNGMWGDNFRYWVSILLLFGGRDALGLQVVTPAASHARDSARAVVIALGDGVCIALLHLCAHGSAVDNAVYSSSKDIQV